MTLRSRLDLRSLGLAVRCSSVVTDAGLLHVVLPTYAQTLLILTLVDYVHALRVVRETRHHLLVPALLGVVLVLVGQQTHVAVLVRLGLKSLLGALAVSLFVLLGGLGLTKLVFELQTKTGDESVGS